MMVVMMIRARVDRSGGDGYLVCCPSYGSGAGREKLVVEPYVIEVVVACKVVASLLVVPLDIFINQDDKKGCAEKRKTKNTLLGLQIKLSKIVIVNKMSCPQRNTIRLDLRESQMDKSADKITKTKT